MIDGHGDDLWRFGHPIRANFSSNVFSRVDLTPLKRHLAARLDAIGNYPEPEPYTLERAIAAREGIPSGAVCVTNGATEAIYLTALAFCGSRSQILHPTFSEYGDACRIHGHVIVQENSDLVWLCNPNNPTGSVLSKERVQEMIAGKSKTYIIDQSYGFFALTDQLTAAEGVAAGNVLQLHSMTKRYAMPGLRLGYVTGAPQLLERIRKARMPWSVNALAIEAGLYLTEHPDTAPIDLPALLDEAQRLRRALDSIPGISVRTTDTHFMLCHILKGSAADLKQWLAREKGLLIRDASNFEGLGSGHFRIAAQTREENDLLITAIEEYVKR